MNGYFNAERYIAACQRMERDPINLTEEDFLHLRQFDHLEQTARERQRAAQVARDERLAKAGPSKDEQLAGVVAGVIKLASTPLVARLATLEHENRTLAARVLNLEATAAAREKVNA